MWVSKYVSASLWPHHFNFISNHPRILDSRIPFPFYVVSTLFNFFTFTLNFFWGCIHLLVPHKLSHILSPAQVAYTRCAHSRLLLFTCLWHLLEVWKRGLPALSSRISNTLGTWATAAPQPPPPARTITLLTSPKIQLTQQLWANHFPC